MFEGTNKFVLSLRSWRDPLRFESQPGSGVQIPVSSDQDLLKVHVMFYHIFYVNGTLARIPMNNKIDTKNVNVYTNINVPTLHLWYI